MIQLAVAGDYEAFAREEIGKRRPLSYPPFGRLLRVVVRGKKEDAVKRLAGAVKEALGRVPAGKKRRSRTG